MGMVSMVRSLALGVMILAFLPSWANTLVMTPDVKPGLAPRDEQTLKSHLRAYRANPEEPQIWLEVGQDYLSLANESKWHYLDQAASFFDRVIERFPKMPLALMLRGRVQGAKALDMKPSTLTRLKWARQGFKQMDAAVKLDTKDAYLRLLRAEAGLLAHPILRRGPLLEQDAKVIIAHLKSETFKQATPWLQARVHLFLGNYLQRQKKASEATSHWQKVVDLAPGTKEGKEATRRLAGTFKSLGYEES